MSIVTSVFNRSPQALVADLIHNCVYRINGSQTTVLGVSISCFCFSLEEELITVRNSNVGLAIMSRPVIAGSHLYPLRLSIFLPVKSEIISSLDPTLMKKCCNAIGASPLPWYANLRVFHLILPFPLLFSYFLL